MDRWPENFEQYIQGDDKKNQTVRSEICNEYVAFFLDQIRNSLSNYSWPSVFRKVISQYEALLHRRAQEKIQLVTAKACYEEIPNREKIVNEERRATEALSLALRILIEIVAAEPPHGSKELSTEDYDSLLAKTSLLLDWSIISDFNHSGLINIPIKISDSGRIVPDREQYNKCMGNFINKKNIEIEEWNRDSFSGYFSIEDGSDTFDERVKEVDNAFHAEFGIALTRILDLLCLLSGIASGQEDSIGCVTRSTLKSIINREIGLESDELNAALDLLTLKPRGSYEVVPEGYHKNDFLPWRYHRRLSYITKPLILAPEPEVDPYVYWGARNAHHAADFLIKLITTGEYEKFHPKTKEMRTLIGKIINEEGKKFTNDVFVWLKKNSSWDLKKEIEICRGGELDNEENLGDIDVLALLQREKIILSIECKTVFFGRNPHEIKQELERFHDKRKGKKGYIEIHEKRAEWLSRNVKSVLSLFGVKDDSEYIVKSIFIISDEISINYLKKFSMELIPFTDLQREGLIRILSILPPFTE